MSRAYEEALRRAVQTALDEDLAGYGDVTGAVFAGLAAARVVARQDGVCSGARVLETAARLTDVSLRVDVRVADGERFDAGRVLAVVEGSAAAILAIERTVLNFLGRLSGVATLTAAYVEETAGTSTRIAATRKTTPGLRALEKRAVIDGGGIPHRFGLFDGVMVKDNHVAAAGGVLAAAALIRAQAPHAHGFEIEVDRLDQIEDALQAHPDVILLDNMDVATVREAVRRINRRAIVEVSGGVSLERVREFAACGVDVISVGALTTRAPWIDVALDMEE
ncbi:MAG: carboxylating nicotinate-nucleotide diphosphorylase [Thermoleophilia bacterium]